MKTYTYKQVGDLEIRANVYEPVGTHAGPVVVWIHGGALIMGHRDGVIDELRAGLLDACCVVVSIDYRLAPETKLPEIVSDLEDAFDWIREASPALLGADPSRLAVMGGSAGGYLTLLAGYRIRPRPAALVSLYGYGDLIGPWYSEPSSHARHHQITMSREEAFRQVNGSPISDSRDRPGDGSAFYQFLRQNGLWPEAVSGWDPRSESARFAPFMPLANVTPEYPPTLLIHGTVDTDVPYEQSVLMAQAFETRGVEHRLITLEGVEHGLAGAGAERKAEVYRVAVSFLAEGLGLKTRSMTNGTRWLSEL